MWNKCVNLFFVIWLPDADHFPEAANNIALRMLIYLFSVVIIVHAIIHAAGFSGMFGKGGTQLYSTSMQRFTGILWLAACLLFQQMPTSVLLPVMVIKSV